MQKLWLMIRDMDLKSNHLASIMLETEVLTNPGLTND